MQLCHGRLGGPATLKELEEWWRQVGDTPLEATTAHPRGESSGTKLGVREVGIGMGAAVAGPMQREQGWSLEASGLPM